ncbi:putative homeodomain-like HTH_23 containing protein 1 [Homarus americanus]|uniref:Putative homeodomain-like HTH_23 containing protein 1 n=1 Tax=Homarus americanus TaxID=6706 RepID=A0A8J5JW52_HOMAM|nr:putative homeodomain-like HTH_23 containing protein 1 [Homarus americanus]
MNRRATHVRTMKTDRLRIVWMWLSGMSARSISYETGASICTVYRWIRRWQEEGTVDTRPYRGRPRDSSWMQNARALAVSEVQNLFTPTHSVNSISGSLPLYCYLKTVDDYLHGNVLYK